MRRYCLDYNPILEYFDRIEKGEIKVSNKIYRWYKYLAWHIKNPDEYHYSANLPTTAPEIKGTGSSALQKASQLNLTIQMDGNVVGRAALNTVDMLQGAKVNLTRRGIANA